MAVVRSVHNDEGLSAIRWVDVSPRPLPCGAIGCIDDVLVDRKVFSSVRSSPGEPHAVPTDQIQTHIRRKRGT